MRVPKILFLDRENLAWAAGFYEGEGTFRGYHKSKHRKKLVRSPSVQIAQVNKEPLIRFHKATCGIGKIYGPYPNGTRRQDYYVFIATSFETAQATVAMLWPWLSRQKRNQIISELNRFHSIRLDKPGPKV